MQNNRFIQALGNPKAKDFIIRHLDDDVHQLALKYSKSDQRNITEYLHLITLYQKAKSKLPEFIKVFPVFTQKSYMQSSSERVAKYKSSLMHGQVLLDLTAGLGIDDIYMSAHFEEIHAVELDQELHEMACFNLEQLGIKNIKRICDRAENRLRAAYDWVYIDPDRRPQNKRVVSFHLMEPPVLDLIPAIRSITKHCMIKLSPMFELKEVIRQVKHVKELMVISEKNEVKELMVILDFDHAGTPTIGAVDLNTKDFSYTSTMVATSETSSRITAGQTLYLPLNALVKAHIDDEYMSQFGVFKYPDLHLYFSQELYGIEGARAFQIAHVGSPSSKLIRAWIEEEGLTHANVLVKGKRTKEDWYKKLGIKEGGEVLIYILLGREKKAFLAKSIMN